jgi:hypothetical protein
MKFEFLGLLFFLEWSDDGLWRIFSKKDNSKQTHYFSVFKVEMQETTVLAIVLLKVVIKVGKLRSPLAWLKSLFLTNEPSS